MTAALVFALCAIALVSINCICFINNMKEFDYLNLDGRLLLMFKTVYDEQSVTAAAARLGVNQSTVSHGLARLRDLLGDPLFIKSGRNIIPSQRADQLAGRVDKLLDGLKELGEVEDFSPSDVTDRFVISAHDYQRELLMPKVFRKIREQAPNAGLKIINTAGRIIEDLRARRTDLVISPLSLRDSEDIMGQLLFTDAFTCFYDAEMVSPPQTMEDYVKAQHARVSFTNENRSLVDELLIKTGYQRNFTLEVPGFIALSTLMRGTPLIATLPSRLGHFIMSDFASFPCPFPAPALTFHHYWHKRDNASPKHQWLRSLVREAAESA